MTLNPPNRLAGLLFMLLVIASGVAAIGSVDAVAQTAPDAAALTKEIDKNLRAAERDMFNGKNESADQQLQAIALQIKQLETVDAADPKLKSLQSKYDRIRKNLDRKLGATTPDHGAASPAAAPTTSSAAGVVPVQTEPPPAATPEQAVLPRAVQSDMNNARTKLDETEAEWAKDHTGKTTVSGLTDPRAVKLDAIEQPLKSANYYYGNVLSKCQRQSSPCDPDHPEITALRDRLAAMQANVDALQQELAVAKSAEAAAAANAAAQSQAAQAECEAWKERMQVYTDGDKALYRCVSAGADAMPACKAQYDEAAALLAEFEKTAWAEEPCGAMHSTLSDLRRYMENFASSYAAYEEEHAQATANMGKIVFSKEPLNPGNPSGLTEQFAAGDYIYGLIQTTRPWSEIYDGKSTADVMVNVKVDGAKIHAQFVKLQSPRLMAQQYLVFEIAPDPDTMTAYNDPDRVYGSSTATMRQGPNELTHHLAQLGPGEHTMSFDITYFGTTWAAGSFTISGGDFGTYADLNQRIAKSVAEAVTLPPAQMTDKAMAAKMKALLENAGWEGIHRINIVDKEWWIDRVSGGDSPVQSRHVAAAALARDGDGYYYKVCTFHQDKLLTGGFGDLYLSHQGDRVPVPKANIDK